MIALSALLARDHVVPPQKLDEAIQRQVINGGDFATNLLEVGAIAEDTLVGYCAAVHESEPIGRDEIIAANERAIGKLTREMAQAQQVLPVRMQGETLVVAAAAPLSAETREALERASGGPVEVRITTPFRLSWGLWRFYGTELSPRLQRLADRLTARPSGQIRAVSSAPGVTSKPASVRPGPRPRLRPSVLAALTAALTEERDSYAGDAPLESF